MLVTGNQLRAARALAEIEQKWLALKSGVSINTIRNMEARGAKAITSGVVTVRKVQVALEAEGIVFVQENGDGPGVRVSRFAWRPIAAPPPKGEEIEIRDADGKTARVIYKEGQPEHSPGSLGLITHWRLIK